MTFSGRFEAHLEKHSDGKPPYICEVCGAHYKHKRACDIHVALHKGNQLKQINDFEFIINSETEGVTPHNLDFKLRFDGKIVQSHAEFTKIFEDFLPNILI